MKKQIFAVCDLEAEYACNFMDYLNQKKNIPFEIQAFTSVESLVAYVKKNPVELLLISSEAMCREVGELDIGKIVILTEGSKPKELEKYTGVYKYQASSDVVREVMACYGAGEGNSSGAAASIKEDDGDTGSIFAAGRLPSDLLCTDTGADIGQGKKCPLSESGRVCRV